MRRILAGLTIAAVVALPVINFANPASSAVAKREAVTVSAQVSAWHPVPRWHAYLWAIQHDKGCWYVYGGNGPCWAGFDCSGLVVDAYAHAGFRLPRTTWEMLGSAMLQRIPASWLRPGDLVFMFGGGHVEVYTGWWTWTFGAHDQGSRSGFTRWSSVYGFYRVRGAG